MITELAQTTCDFFLSQQPLIERFSCSFQDFFGVSLDPKLIKTQTDILHIYICLYVSFYDT